ncbi:MAG: leucine efflux protein LeuE [Cardiobacteriaceae bacterium]|nr:leucine efflux protein LeuE [Cardiobacteriaceae bacterium]
MDGITDLHQYILGTIAIILLPGPNSLYCLSVAGQYGASNAYRVIAGIMLGDAMLILATVLGAGVVLARYPLLFHAMKVAGGLYLLWLALGLLRGAWQVWQTRRNSTSPVRQVKRQNFFRRALTLSLMNPKAIFFFLSFFLPFVRTDAENPAWSFFILAAILQTTSFLYLNFLTFIGHRLAATFSRFRLFSALCMAAVGVMFAAFAVKLWMSTL